MNRIFGLLLLIFIAYSCEKNKEVQPVTNQIEQGKKQKDSLEKEKVKVSDEELEEVDKIDEYLAPKKVIFVQNGKTIIYFDVELNLGKFLFLDKELIISNLTSEDNSYFAEGEDFKIYLEEGVVNEVARKDECSEMNFAEMVVNYKGKQTILKKVSVVDCSIF